MPTASATDTNEPATRASPPARSSAEAWRGLALLALTLCVYWPALLGDFIWDDDAHITKTALRSLDGLRRIWLEIGATQQYYPLLHSAFWIEARLWGDAVLGYHLVNVVLHVVAACLVVTLCQRLSIKGAWLAGAIFVLHPVNVESVAWISEQKNTLSLVFYLLSAIAYVTFDDGRRARDYAIAGALFVCALMTKTVTASLPAALIVVIWWKRGRVDWKRDVLPLVPWFVMAAMSGLFTAWVERHIIGAAGSEYNLDVLQRALLAGRVICFYFAKIIWPANLTFTYPHWTIDSRVAWQYGFDLALIAAAVACWSFRSSTRAPLAALLFFGGSLFPVLGFLDIYPFRYSYVADHFAYLASLGLIIPVSAAIATAYGRAGNSTGRALRIAIGVVLLVLAGLSNLQSRMYTDPITLYRTTIARNPDSWMAHQNLGRILSRTTHRNEEIAEYEAVLRLKPEHARAHYGLGVALLLSGRGAEAVDHFEKAMKFEPNNPLIAGYSHYFLGVIFTKLPGRIDDAVAHLEEAVRLQPGDRESRSALDAALLARQKAFKAKAASPRPLPLPRPESS